MVHEEVHAEIQTGDLYAEEPMQAYHFILTVEFLKNIS